MNVIGIIALSLLAGIVLVVQIGGLATLIVLHLRVQKSHVALAAAMEKFAMDAASSSGQARESLSGIVEGARNSFGGIRKEIVTAQENQSRSIEIVLKAHSEGFNAALGKINGEALTRASIEALRALRELSALVVTLKNLLVDHQAPAAELGPEEYGPSDELFVRTSDTARMDAQEERESASIYGSQFDAGLPVVRTEQ